MDDNYFNNGIINSNNLAGRLIYKEVSYFNLLYPSTNDSPITNKHGLVFYRDIYIFINRLEDLVSFKGKLIIYKLIPLYLYRSALI